MQAENADSAGLNPYSRFGRLRLRVAPRMRSIGERTTVYIDIYIYISCMTARPLSPQEGARSRSPNYGTRLDTVRYAVLCTCMRMCIDVQVARGRSIIGNWGEREQGRTLLMSM